MREVAVSFLRDELIRLGAVVVQTRLFHPCGLKLHSPGDAVTFERLKSMQELGFEKVVLLEPGEGEQAAQRALSTEMIPLMDLRKLDVVAEDLFGADGTAAVHAGQVVDEGTLRTALRSGAGQVTIRRRNLETLVRHAQEYVDGLPPRPARPPRPDTRVNQMTTRAMPAPVRPLLVPRARVLVALKDDFQRALIANAIAAEGHEVSELSEPREAALAARSTRPDAVLVDLADAAAFCGVLRAPGIEPGVAVLVVADESRREEIHKAFLAGVNEVLALPPRPQAIHEKLRGCLQAAGRRVNLRPHVQAERRAGPREPGNFACGLLDKFLSKPLAVSSATVLDVSEGGLRIEYGVPAVPGFDAWMGHAVHPRHSFYNYSKQSPLGRDLTVRLPAPRGGAPLEAMARFVHVERNKEYEIAGLAFQRVRGSVRDHLTLIRGKATEIRPGTAITVRRPAF